MFGFFESAEVSAIVVFTGILPNSSAPRSHPTPYNVAACLPRGVFLMTDGSLFSHAGGNFINSVSADRTRHPASFKVNPAKTPTGVSCKTTDKFGTSAPPNIQIVPFNSFTKFTVQKLSLDTDQWEVIRVIRVNVCNEF